MNSLPILAIKNLKAAIDDNEIWKNLNLKVYQGQIHAIMGPNGSGKSTSSKVLGGHPAYQVLGGEVFLLSKIQLKFLVLATKIFLD